MVFLPLLNIQPTCKSIGSIPMVTTFRLEMHLWGAIVWIGPSRLLNNFNWKHIMNTNSNLEGFELFLDRNRLQINNLYIWAYTTVLLVFFLTRMFERQSDWFWALSSIASIWLTFQVRFLLNKIDSPL